MKIVTESTADGRGLIALTQSKRGATIGAYTTRDGRRWLYAIPGLAAEREISPHAVPPQVLAAGEGWAEAKQREETT